MIRILLILLLPIVLMRSAYAGFNIGIPGAVVKHVKKLDDKVNKKTQENATPAAPQQEWALVPGNATFGTSDFYVMKYEAKNVGGVPFSQANLSPWVNIGLTDAVSACTALGGGAHLVTINEAQTINRDIEAQSANWADGVIGSLVSSGGGLKRGNAGVNDSAGYDGANPEFGDGRNTKAKLVLSNGSEIWDWAGNVAEWIYGTGVGGALGTPSGVTFTDTVTLAWSDVAANEERPILGPSNSAWNDSHGVGAYSDARLTGAPRRGGYWQGIGSYESVGVFSLSATNSLSDPIPVGGFRCAK